MRWFQHEPILFKLWALSELEYNRSFYVYMGVGTVTAFMIFGTVIGRYAQRQRAHNRELRKRVEALHLQSVTDGLTGAYSHAYLMETLSIELERARRHGHPVSVLMLDSDDFKKINDTHGHLFGDQVLKEVTETISMNIRHEDVLGRYGGEEFMVVMPGADASVSERVAERVRAAVARRGILDSNESAGSRSVRPTISIGASCFSASRPQSATDLIGAADANLYKAKGSGKNRVVSPGSRI